jgi:hypothetical protein
MAVREVTEEYWVTNLVFRTLASERAVVAEAAALPAVMRALQVMQALRLLVFLKHSPAALGVVVATQVTQDLTGHAGHVALM